MRTPEVQIVLSPTALRVCVVRKGAAGLSHTVDLDPQDWDKTWQSELESLDSPLQAALEAIGVLGCEPDVRVLYHGPEVLIEAFTSEVEKAQAQREARSTMSDAHEAGAGDRVMGDRVLVCKGAAAGTRIAVLVASDCNASLELLCQWLGRCGCTCSELVPLGGAMLGGVVKQLLGTEHDGPRAMMHMGEHGTVLAASDSGQLVLARVIRFGYEQLVEACARALRSEGGERDHEQAIEILFGIGVPESHDSGIPGLNTVDVLPLLQPVLQRYIIEIKQTIRFGLGTVGEGEIELLLSGPGSLIPGLQQMFNGQLVSCRVGTVPSVLTDESSHAESFECLMDWRSTGVSLSPDSLVQMRNQSRFKQVVAAGLVLCAAVIGMDWASTNHQISLVESAVASVSADLIQSQTDYESRSKARHLAGSVVQVRRDIQDRISRGADLTAFMAELSHATIPGIALTELSVGNELQGQVVATIRGLASAGEAVSRRDPLREYMETLGASSLVTLVELGSTQRMQVEGTDAVVFSLTVFLHRDPKSIDWESHTR